MTGAGGHKVAGDIELSRIDLEHPAVFDEAFSLCSGALGWRTDEPNRELFAWKHLRNPFGVSAAWAARSDGQMVGVRLLLRWEAQFEGRSLNLVRAVDTATAPGHQGQGIFQGLTTRAIEELTTQGVSAVFNTPNDRSRPGYLKMGWVELTRLPVRAAPTSARALNGLRNRSLGAATKWGEAVEVGEDPSEVFADEDAISSLLAGLDPGRGCATRRSYAHLCWRFSLGALGYRVWKVNGRTSDGLVVFRVRRRGSLRELALVDVLLPHGRGLQARTWHHLARRCGADMVTTSVGTGRLVHGLVPLPRRFGPVLTWRPLADERVPTPRQLSFAHADLELF